MFSHEFTVKLRHTDAAGVVFFASYFTIAHDVYELALEEVGEPLGAWLGDVPMPLVRSEASYLAPLRHGERARVDLGVARVGGRSFTLSYVFWVQATSERRWDPRRAPSTASSPVDLDAAVLWRKACELKTVHVAIDPQSGESIALPPRVSSALERLGPPSSQEP